MQRVGAVQAEWRARRRQRDGVGRAGRPGAGHVASPATPAAALDPRVVVFLFPHWGCDEPSMSVLLLMMAPWYCSRAWHRTGSPAYRWRSRWCAERVLIKRQRRSPPDTSIVESRASISASRTQTLALLRHRRSRGLLVAAVRDQGFFLVRRVRLTGGRRHLAPSASASTAARRRPDGRPQRSAIQRICSNRSRSTPAHLRTGGVLDQFRIGVNDRDGLPALVHALRRAGTCSEMAGRGLHPGQDVRRSDSLAELVARKAVTTVPADGRVAQFHSAPTSSA